MRFRRTSPRHSGGDSAALTNQAADQYDRYKESGDFGALRQALALAGAAVAATRFRDPMWASRLYNGSFILFEIYQVTGDHDILNAAASHARAAVAATTADDPGGAKHLTKLVAILSCLAEQNGDVEILREAASFGRAALSVAPDGPPDMAHRLYNLAITLDDVFERTGDLDALHEAITVGRAAVAGAPAADPHQSRYADELCRRLHGMFERTGDLDALGEAIAVGRAAVAGVPAADPHRSRCADGLGSCLHSLFQRTGDLDALHEAITVRRAACAAMASDHPDRPRCLFNLAVTLFSEFEQTGGLDALREAMATDRAAMAATPVDDVSYGRYVYHLSYYAYRLFERTGEPDALREAVTAGRLAVAAPVAETSSRASHLHHLCVVLRRAFEENGDLGALREAVTAGRAALEVMPDDEPELALRLVNISAALFLLSGAADEPDALADALALCAAAVAATGSGDPDRAGRVSALGGMMAGVLRSVRNGEVLRQVAAQASAAVVAAQNDDDGPQLTLELSDLVIHVSRIFDEHVDPAALQELGLLREGLLIRQSIQSALASSHGEWAGCLGELSTCLGTAVELNRNADIAAFAITVGRAAIAAAPADDVLGRAMLQADLTRALRCLLDATRYRGIRESAEVVRARQAGKPDVAPEPEGLRPADLTPEELDIAVGVLRADINDGSPEQDRLLSLLGDSLMVRFGRSGVRHDLDSAVDALRKASDATAADDPKLISRLRWLSNALTISFGHTGSRDDIDAAIHVAGAALDAISEGDPRRAEVLNDRGRALEDRYRTARALADLTTAISNFREAVDTASPDDPRRGEYFNNLGYALEIRYARSDSLGDLDAAVEAYQAAVGAAPAGGQAWAFYQANLGDALVRRGGVARNFGVIMLGFMHRAASGGRGTITRAELDADLDNGIAALRAARAAIPADDPYRMSILMHLAGALISRFHRDEEPSDLDEAISLYAAAQDALDDDQDAIHGSAANRRVGLLGEMAAALLTRFRRTGSRDDLEAGLPCYLLIASTPTAEPLARINAARAAARWIEPTSPGDAAEVLEQAVELLPGLFLPELDRSDQTHLAHECRQLASHAAALALADPRPAGEQRAARALRLLETGRSALLNQALALRSDVAQLRRSHPELAGRLSHLRGQLSDDPTVFEPGAAPLRPAGASGRHELAGELAATFDQIRALPGFESFGMPLPPSAYRGEAVQGPVVTFNVSPGLGNAFITRGGMPGTMTELVTDLRKVLPDLGETIADLSDRASTSAACRSDAILLTEAGLRPLELPGLTADAVAGQVRNLYQAIHASGNVAEPRSAEQAVTRVLEWLWDNAAGPVLDALGYAGEPPADAAWPRVWWAPGGMLGLLPLHAAGYHTDPPGSRRTVMDRVISSYTPTIGALHRARDRPATAAPATSSLIVAMPATPDRPGAGPLPGAEAEAALLEQVLPHPRLLTSGATSANDQPAVAAVLAAMTDHAIAHFACHAQSDPIDPSRSRLHLCDHDLTVADLDSVNLDNAQLAYLSACSTATVSTGAPHGIDLIDSMLNIAGALHLAGYPHVIATQWEVRDSISARIAGAFYTGLRTEPTVIDVSHAACALNATVRTIRDKFPGNPSLWAAHMHIGI